MAGASASEKIDVSEKTTSTLIVLNADGSNRHKDINNAETLADYIYKTVNTILCSDDPSEEDCLIVVSEFLTKGYELLKIKLSYEGRFFEFSDSDKIAFYWNTEYWNPLGLPEREASHYKIGKYMPVALENKATKVRLLIISVHMPLPKNAEQREKAFLELTDFTKGSIGQYVDIIIIAGDFNTAPSDLKERFTDWSFGIPHDCLNTTRKKSIDNLIMLGSIRSPHYGLVPKTKFKSHFPLYFKVVIGDTDKDSSDEDTEENRPTDKAKDRGKDARREKENPTVDNLASQIKSASLSSAPKSKTKK